MKKIIMLLGFVLGSMLAVQAQETEQAGDGAEEMSTEGVPENSGMSLVPEAEWPQVVKDGIANSDYKGATIDQVYEVSGQTLDLIVENRQEDAEAKNKPDKLYQVKVTSQDRKSTILYLTEDGEIFDESKL